MKRYGKIRRGYAIIIAICVLMIVFLPSCQNNRESKSELEGKWYVDKNYGEGELYWDELEFFCDGDDDKDDNKVKAGELEGKYYVSGNKITLSFGEKDFEYIKYEIKDGCLYFAPDSPEAQQVRYTREKIADSDLSLEVESNRSNSESGTSQE